MTDQVQGNILSEILKKRLEFLGYPSLKKFFEDRKDLGISYELLRQVIYRGKTPRSDTMSRILQSMRFSPSQSRKILGLCYKGYSRPDLDQGPADPGDSPPRKREDEGAPRPDEGLSDPAAEERRLSQELAGEEPDEIAARLVRSLSKIPSKGNEDFWEMARQLALLAERKVRDSSRRHASQPPLFEKEPEAVYHFLVRSGKVIPYMSKGETVPLAFLEGIDYRDRFRGALLGTAAGYRLGRATQGLSPRDVAELYGRIEGYREAGGKAGRPDETPPFLLLARSLRERKGLDPKTSAALYAASALRDGAGSLAEFARNLTERGYPWFEAGISAPESLPAARIAPLALLRAGDFRLMKLEAGLEAAVTHPHPAAVAGAVAQAVAMGRLLHTPPGSLDVLGFGRTLASVVAGFESDRSVRALRPGRPGPSLWRRLGTELPALLMRRAGIEEIRDALGNGASALEGIPFAMACFLRSPDDFASAVLEAANQGNEAQGNAALAGALCGAYAGAKAIPPGLLNGLPWKEELIGAADALLAAARRGREG